MDTCTVVQVEFGIPVLSTVTCLDHPAGSRFVATSDDKYIGMWEFGIYV
jgi:hypothetical protein